MRPWVYVVVVLGALALSELAAWAITRAARAPRLAPAPASSKP